MTIQMLNRLVGSQGAPRPLAISQTIAIFALAIIATGMPVLGHFADPLIGMAICLALGVAIAAFAAPILPIVLIFSYLFQNLFVSLASPGIVDLTEFKTIRGYNFVLTAAAWMILIGQYWVDRSSFDRRFRSVMNAVFASLVLIGCYFFIGALDKPLNAAIYLRNVVTPFMLFQICALVAARFQLTIASAFMIIAYAIMTYGYAELFFHRPLLDLLNGDAYLQLLNRDAHDSGVWVRAMQETGWVVRSDLDTLEVDFLNTSLFGNFDIRITRLLGPNFHPISYAYALAILNLVAVTTGNRIYCVFSLPLLMVIGSKGALAVLILSMIGLVGSKLLGRWLLCSFIAVLAAYAVTGIVIGIEAADYHVIGFMGSVRGFIENPVGHGLGSGGNFDSVQLDWQRSQHLGYTEIAVESAIGVLLFQMGIAAFVLLAAVAGIACRAWKLYLQSNNPLVGILALGALVVLVNGIFQEEALFSPLALGMVLSFLGLLMGRRREQRFSGTKTTL